MSFSVAATLFPRSAWRGKLSEFSVITCCISEQGNGSSGPLSFSSAVQYLTCPPVFGGFIHTQQKLNIPDDLILPSRSQDTGNLMTNQTYGVPGFKSETSDVKKPETYGIPSGKGGTPTKRSRDSTQWCGKSSSTSLLVRVMPETPMRSSLRKEAPTRHPRSKRGDKMGLSHPWNPN